MLSAELRVGLSVGRKMPETGWNGELPLRDFALVEDSRGDATIAAEFHS